MCDLVVFADENNVDVVRLWHLTVGELCINITYATSVPKTPNSGALF